MTGAEEIAIGGAILDALAKLIDTWRATKAGAVAPDVALKAVADLHAALAADNAAAEQAVHDKFDTAVSVPATDSGGVKP